MEHCPYCSGRVLRHVQNSQIYWFCRHCWQRVPLMDAPPRSSLSCAHRSALESHLKSLSSLENSVHKYDPVMRS